MSDMKLSDMPDHSNDSKSENITDKNTIITFRIADTGIGIKKKTYHISLIHFHDSMKKKTNISRGQVLVLQ